MISTYVVFIMNNGDIMDVDSSSIDIKSRISDGHRLLSLASSSGSCLYNKNEFFEKAHYISPQIWMNNILSSLNQQISETVTRRLIAAVRRVNSKRKIYSTHSSDIAAICTEVLFDSQLFRPNESHVSRVFLYKKIANLLKSSKGISIGLPLFSRKPVSPLKNRGGLPDISEIVSIARCYEVAKILSEICQREVKLTIFADGRKYARACNSPERRIKKYQQGLHFWNDHLGTSHLVKIVDYEEVTHHAIGGGGDLVRTAAYEEKLSDLDNKYGCYFDPRQVDNSLSYISSLDDEGMKIQYTYYSIVSSIYYYTADVGVNLENNIDDNQKFYLEYIQSLNQKNSTIQYSDSYIDNREAFDTIVSMRHEAWYAALRYIAISDTDQTLGIWHILNGDNIKFTIHPKPNEIHFVQTSSEYNSMTAQHCVGGIKLDKSGPKFSFLYRLEREMRNEGPILFDPKSEELCGEYDFLNEYVQASQPISYVSSDIQDVKNIITNNVIRW